MSGFENISVGKSAVPALAVTVILMLAVPAVFFGVWHKKHKQRTNFRWLIAGAVGFVVFARVLEVGVHFLCIVSDNPVSRFINGNTAAFVVYGTVMAGVFEECGRYIVLKYVLKKDRTPENAVMYGIGHGGIEVLTVAVPMMIVYLACAVLFSSGNTENALKTLNITEETAAAALPSVRAAAAFGFGTAAMNVFERLFAVLTHIGLTVIVYYGVCRKNKVCLPAAVGLHMVMDIFPALYQRGAVPMWTVELWAAFWTFAVVFIAARLYGRMKTAYAEKGAR